MTERGWQHGRPRVLVSDNWPANAGDMAIALALEQVVRTIAPDAEVIHATYLHDAALPDLSHVRHTPPLEDLLGTRWRPPLEEWAGAGEELVRSCDVLISQGGGFFYEHYTPETRVEGLDRAVALAPRFALVGQSIGRFDRCINRAAFARILGRAAMIATRDAASMANVLEMGAPRDRTTLGTDLALALVDDRTSPPPDDGTLPVGYVPNLHPMLDRGVSPAAAETIAAALLDEVLEATVRDVVLFSSCQDHGIAAAEDDGPLLHRLRDQASDPGRVRIQGGVPSVSQLIGWCQGVHALVSMRFHPALFAAATGVPVAIVQPGSKGEVLGDSAIPRCQNPLDPVSRQDVVRRALSASVADRDAEVGSLATARTRLSEMIAGLEEVVAACS